MNTYDTILKIIATEDLFFYDDTVEVTSIRWKVEGDGISFVFYFSYALRESGPGWISDLEEVELDAADYRDFIGEGEFIPEHLCFIKGIIATPEEIAEEWDSWRDDNE